MPGASMRHGERVNADPHMDSNRSRQLGGTVSRGSLSSSSSGLPHTQISPRSDADAVDRHIEDIVPNAGLGP
jgi:hypothetical protein